MDTERLSKLPNGVYAISKHDGSVLVFTTAHEEMFDFRKNFDVIAVKNGKITKINKPIRDINEVIFGTTKPEIEEIVSLSEDASVEDLVVSPSIKEVLGKKGKIK